MFYSKTILFIKNKNWFKLYFTYFLKTQNQVYYNWNKRAMLPTATNAYLSFHMYRHKHTQSFPVIQQFWKWKKITPKILPIPMILTNQQPAISHACHPTHSVLLLFDRKLNFKNFISEFFSSHEDYHVTFRHVTL